MVQAKVVPLKTTQLINETDVGPKAASLFRLSRAGLAVPPCFCVTAAVFREHIQRNNLTEHTKSAADELVKSNPEAKTGPGSKQGNTFLNPADRCIARNFCFNRMLEVFLAVVLS